MTPALFRSKAATNAVTQTEVPSLDFAHRLGSPHSRTQPHSFVHSHAFLPISPCLSTATATPAPVPVPSPSSALTGSQCYSKQLRPSILHKDTSSSIGLSALVAELSDNLCIAPHQDRNATTRIASPPKSVFGSTRARKAATFSVPDRTSAPVRAPLSRTLSENLGPTGNATPDCAVKPSAPSVCTPESKENNAAAAGTTTMAVAGIATGAATGAATAAAAAAAAATAANAPLKNASLAPPVDLSRTPINLAPRIRMCESASPECVSDTPTTMRGAQALRFKNSSGTRMFAEKAVAPPTQKVLPAVAVAAAAAAAAAASQTPNDRFRAKMQSCEPGMLTTETSVGPASSTVGNDESSQRAVPSNTGNSADSELGLPNTHRGGLAILWDPWQPDQISESPVSVVHPLRLQFHHQDISMPELCPKNYPKENRPEARRTNAHKALSLPAISSSSRTGNSVYLKATNGKINTTRESFAGVRQPLGVYPPPTKVRRTQSLYPSKEQFVSQYLGPTELEEQHTLGLTGLHGLAHEEQEHKPDCDCNESCDGLAGAEQSGLQTFEIEQDPFRRICREQLVALLDGQFGRHFDAIRVIDCRFEYEYAGGHIDGAININSKEKLQQQLIDNVENIKRCPRASVLLVFHCEYSAYRGPLIASHLRSCDRRANLSRYPYLHYPDIVILEGGYSKFFEQHNSRCVPQSYVGMNDQLYRQACARELERFRSHMSLRKTQSMSFCQGQGSPGRARDAAADERAARKSSFI